MNDLAECLSRTLLLMRDEVGGEVADEVLLSALTCTRVVLVADGRNIASPPAQTAFVTAATLMARSGHKVWLSAPNIRMSGPQPPLSPGRLIDELVAVGLNLIPGVEFGVGEPTDEIDLAIGLGDTPITIPARRRIWINAEAWAGILSGEDTTRPWGVHFWPMGALAAAGLAANEAFKAAMQKLLPYALDRDNTSDRFADSDSIRLRLAPVNSPFCRDLGEVDIVSGGAISNAALYCLARIPGVNGRGRVIEPEAADLSNLNRYMLLLRSGRDVSKATDLTQTLVGGGLHFRALRRRYDSSTVDEIAPFARVVLVGVDHIPTRWLVQQAWPERVVVGATTHWSAMASLHANGSGCAQCLHYEDDPAEGLIPTQACVSFWAGLISAVYLARQAVGDLPSVAERQIFLTPFRPETIYRAPVPPRADCPTCLSRGSLEVGAHSRAAS
ncbi:molybdopterin/thiamine biosynthesis adenylyltransferase [Caulobacter ginsengisoli]|uniref:Molybdopterin/thiamine biosynthesis adenylyltransferase n=1 Tax=Caulobacter ginsengisoli TaxID=400775 RepID=A0ABU0ITL7_9CAUL|nr:hypothetical protein [Caulobacter ginsengisoli]MDQ0464701.1 molybdopterin/thiamine biosynthesis adenylyltransferase [Caulobacter ginsengisoli]